MLESVSAMRIVRKMSSGRTGPLLLECERQSLELVQVVAKFSSGTMQGVKNLAIEAIAAMLAADLCLPVPEPLVVVIEDDFVASLSDSPHKAMVCGSVKTAFGSTLLPPGFSIWPPNNKVPANLCRLAAEIFTFDAIIVNSDRRSINPNCLHRGSSDFAIFDHELSFSPDQVLFWKEPWICGGFDSLCGNEAHIFAKPYLSSCPEDLDDFIGRWDTLDVNRFYQYVAALPSEWASDIEFMDKTIHYLTEAKANIRTIVTNALEVLR